MVDERMHRNDGLHLVSHGIRGVIRADFSKLSELALYDHHSWIAAPKEKMPGVHLSMHHRKIQIM